MYTVVIADDEEEIRRSLVRKIKEMEIGFKVVGEAENGVEALELVEELEPDLLLTDIRMPFISGIELARQVREIRPTMQIAFLSGYDDFTYARQAIQYNIISYLLKPISSKELLKELQNIKEIIDRKFEEFSARNQMQERREKSDFLMPLILDGFQKEMSEQERENLIQNAVLCGVLERGEFKEARNVVVVTMIKDMAGNNCTTRASVNAIDSILKKYVKYNSIYVQGRVVSLLRSTKMGFDKYLHILVEEITQSVRRIMDLKASVGVSRIAQHIEACHECYIEAMNAISYSRDSESSVHFITDEEQVENIDQDMVQNTVSDLEDLLRGGTEDEIKAYLTHFFDRINEGKISQTAGNFVLLQELASVYRVLYAVAGNEAVLKLQQKVPIYNLTIWGVTRQSRELYIELCTFARELISEQKKKSSEMTCERVIRIIDEQYTNPDLSLVTVSAAVSVSPNYLSALLKKDIGSNFKDLLTRRRIEKARDLLVCTSLKIREISEKCGYNDQYYFSYCFKKYTGISPNTCRRNNEEVMNAKGFR